MDLDDSSPPTGFVLLDDSDDSMSTAASSNMPEDLNILTDQPISSISSTDSFVSIASSEADLPKVTISSTAGLDPEKEKTFEFIVRVLNGVLKNAGDRLGAGDHLNACDRLDSDHSLTTTDRLTASNHLNAADCPDTGDDLDASDLDASDSAVYESDSDSCDVPEDSVIKYLNDREHIQLNRSEPIQSREEDSNLAKIIRVLNAAKFRSLATKAPVIADPLPIAPVKQPESNARQPPKAPLLETPGQPVQNAQQLQQALEDLQQLQQLQRLQQAQQLQQAQKAQRPQKAQKVRLDIVPPLRFVGPFGNQGFPRFPAFVGNLPQFRFGRTPKYQQYQQRPAPQAVQQQAPQFSSIHSSGYEQDFPSLSTFASSPQPAPQRFVPAPGQALLPTPTFGHQQPARQLRFVPSSGLLPTPAFSNLQQDLLGKPFLPPAAQPTLHQPILQPPPSSWLPQQPQANPIDLICQGCNKLKLNETGEPDSRESISNESANKASASKEPVNLSAEQLEELYRKAEIKIQKGLCHYCQLNNPNCVLKCSNCPFYFCNGKGQVSFSHIITHLRESGHREIDFKFDGAVGNPDSCNLCNSRNVFTLGFIWGSKSNRYLLCHPPCREFVVEKQGLKERIIGKPKYTNYDEYFTKLRTKMMQFHLYINGEAKLRADGLSCYPHYTFPSNSGKEVANIAKWEPLISERSLIGFVTGVPNKIENVLCRMVSADDIEEIEKKLAAVREVEEKCRFGIDPKDLIDEEMFKKVVDMPVLLSYENGEEYEQVFSNLAKMEKGYKRLAKEEEVGHDYVFNKTCQALKRFATNKMAINPEIYEIILGKKTIQSSVADDPQVDISRYEAPNLPKLNHSQALAIKHSLENPLTLIQGPPGTGKTTTSAAIVYHLSKLSKKKEQILVCAGSNIAVDHLAVKIHETGLNVVRLLSKTKEEDRTYRPPFGAHLMLNHPPPNSELAIFLAQLRRQKWISEYAMRRLERLQKIYLNAILNNADVICVTCVMSSDARLGGRKFKYLLIDEVAQCTEPEVIIPLNRGVQKLVLIGDIQQLAPVIKNKEAIEKGYDQSLMLRLNMLGNPSHMLNLQYRMHPQLSSFSREMFYDGLLKDGVTEHDRILPGCTFQWPTTKPMFFYTCRQEEQVSNTGRSYLNRMEGMAIAKMVLQLVLSGVTATQIGIITPYAGHREHLRTNLKFFSRNIDYEKIEIESINAFQGREKDIIILSTVRSNSFQGRASTGFLGDPRRLNVALTRAKYGMIIVGDHLTLMQEPTWYELLLFYRNNNLIFRGEIPNLEYFSCHLRKPKRSGKTDAKVKGNYFVKSEVKVDENGEKTMKFEKVVIPE